MDDVRVRVPQWRRRWYYQGSSEPRRDPYLGPPSTRGPARQQLVYVITVKGTVLGVRLGSWVGSGPGMRYKKPRTDTSLVLSLLVEPNHEQTSLPLRRNATGSSLGGEQRCSVACLGGRNTMYITLLLSAASGQPSRPSSIRVIHPLFPFPPLPLSLGRYVALLGCRVFSSTFCVKSSFCLLIASLAPRPSRRDVGHSSPEPRPRDSAHPTPACVASPPPTVCFSQLGGFFADPSVDDPDAAGL